MLKLLLTLCLGVNLLVYSLPLDDSVIEGRIIGGDDTDISKVPYQVGVLFQCWFVCGGIIVSPNYVVTAGYCVSEAEDQDMLIRAGSSFFQDGGVLIKSKKIHRHPKYNPHTNDYDVAILELQTPLKFTDKIKPIKLATKEPPVGAEVLVSGWGSTSEHIDIPKILQSLDVPIYDRTKCTTIFKGYNKTITPRMICAGGEGRGTFIADNGGPVVYKGEAVGIVSFNAGCCKKGIPEVYVNIVNPDISKFIKDITKV